MLDILEKYEKRATNYNEKLLKTELSEKTLIAEAVCNNNSLLVKNLKVLFSEKKAQYLPNTIVCDIKRFINDIDNLYNSIEQQPDDASNVLKALQHMDKLYAYCLQFGLITFGFKVKEETQLIQNIRNKINDVEADIVELKKEISTSRTKVDKTWHNLEEKLGSIEKDSVDKINAKLNKFTGDSDALSSELNKNAESYKNEIKEKEKNATSLLSEITSQRDTAKQASEACNNHLNEITNAHTSATKKLNEATNSATQTNQQLVNAQSYANDTNTQLKNATQYAADTKAKDDAAAQHLANAKQRQQEIDTFYKDIETHKKEMLEFKKRSEANYNQLKSDCDSKVEDYTQKTESVVIENQKLQDEIKVLLQKAVSAGLFGVFKKRQQFLTVTRFIWAILVFASAIALSFHFYKLAFELANIKGVGLNIAFFIRSGTMIPLIYIMYFSAAQYKKDRQAEEEYAFKSAISFSLEPYRDLLIKMKEEHGLEADFVKELMEDIFDNPVKRLFRHKGDKTEADELIDVLSSLVGKIPNR